MTSETGLLDGSVSSTSYCQLPSPSRWGVDPRLTSGPFPLIPQLVAGMAVCRH